MKAQAQPEVYLEFLERLQSAPTRVLLLDYDGTLAPFQTDRARAFPYPEVPALLGRISQAGTRVILITGRPAREVVLLSGLHPHPEIWGSHGLERLSPDGTYRVDSLMPEQETGLLQAAEILRSHNLEPRMEIKPGSVALHWRGSPQAEIEAFRHLIVPLWSPLVEACSLQVLDFDGGVEIRVRDRDKGRAVRAILEECSSSAAVAYLGDDFTDEDAFHALRGRGLTALVREEPRQTFADIQLRPPQELIRFLEDWVNTTGGQD